MTFDQELRAENGTGVGFALLTFTHPDLTAPIYLSADPTEIASDHPRTYKTRSRGIDFDYAPMGVVFPGGKTKQAPQGQLTIADPDYLVYRTLETLPIGVQADVLMEFVHSSDLDTPEVTIPNMKLVGASHDKGFFQARLAFDGRLSQRYPADVYNPANFPALSV